MAFGVLGDAIGSILKERETYVNFVGNNGAVDVAGNGLVSEVLGCLGKCGTTKYMEGNKQELTQRYKGTSLPPR